MCIRDRVTFVNTTAAHILESLPLQSLDTAIVLVNAYISDVLGWVPDVPEDPTGEGMLFNGFTEQQAAEAIIEEQFGAVYDLNFNVTVTLNVQAIAQLASGLTLEQVAGSMANQVSAFITEKVNDSSIPVRIADIG